jgi:hypothetical protein
MMHPPRAAKTRNKQPKPKAATPPPGAPPLMQLAERMRRDLREELRDR